MKAIILAAGIGSRLMPLTKDKPKCMVEYKGKQIIDYILESLRKNGITDVVIVKGYKADKLQKENVKYYINEQFAITNMVYTLFCAEKELTDDIIISYADIVYNKETLEVLLKDDSSMAVVIDKNWRTLWERRMSDPLTDAETLKLNKENYVIEFFDGFCADPVCSIWIIFFLPKDCLCINLPRMYNGFPSILITRSVPWVSLFPPALRTKFGLYLVTILTRFQFGEFFLD